MSISRRMIGWLRLSFRRRVVFGLSMAVVWTAWFVAPASPDLRLEVTVPWECIWGMVTADGRSLVCAVKQGWLPSHYQRQVEVFELPTGRHRFTLRDDKDVHFTVSPNGKCMWVSAADDQQLRKLPSGDVIRLWRASDQSDSAKWAPDSRHLLSFGLEAVAMRSETGEVAGRYDVDETTFAMRPNGAGIIALAKSAWELRCCSFGSDHPDFVVPIPGPPAYRGQEPGELPKNGSIVVGRCATNDDASIVFATFYRFHQEGDIDRSRLFLARWDRETREWTEADLGPDTKGSHQGSTLTLDASGQLLNTRELSLRQDMDGNRDHDGNEIWGFEEAKQFEGRRLWDAMSSPPKCFSDSVFCDGVIFFSPSGRRFIHNRIPSGTIPGVVAIRDTKSLELVNSLNIGTSAEPVYSSDGEWAALVEERYSQLGSKMPMWTPGWLVRIFGMTTNCIHVIQLADGQAVRMLSDRTNPYFTSDGWLWTVTFRHGGDVAKLVVERWALEPSGVPWWLMVITACGVVLVAIPRRLAGG